MIAGMVDNTRPSLRYHDEYGMFLPVIGDVTIRSGMKAVRIVLRLDLSLPDVP